MAASTGQEKAAWSVRVTGAGAARIPSLQPPHSGGMTTDQADDLSVLQAPQAAVLARQLVESVGNHQMRRATVVLASFRGGYWLRRFIEEPALGAVEPHDRPTLVNWAGVLKLLRTPELLDDNRRGPGTMGPHLTVLEIAASLAAGRPSTCAGRPCSFPGRNGGTSC